MNKQLLRIAPALLLALAGHAAQAAIKVLACEPEWGALVQELAGDKASVYVATTGLQDPHHIQARPSLVAAARTTDLLVCTGAELEVGWLPVLIRQSGNNAIQPGKPGNFAAADFVRKLEVPDRLDRADGDVHAAGNPHIQTDPRNIALVAGPLAKRLAEIDPANAATYQARAADFATRWSAAIARWEKQAAPLRGTPIVVQHKAFPYLEQWLGLVEVAALEPKPGIEPTSAHLSAVLAELQTRPAKMILRAAYNDGRGAEWLADRARLPVVVLPFTVGGDEQAKDLFSLFDDTVQRLLKGLP
ncbi:MAG TPA: zinc ABC transporter substrate-binding protein [Burkholderiaceae bacterium]|jgi:zinc/manganese transport system substrate-binding protein|nr:zinc ABC transporter substrate-binding protein [Burkholderiaceae bacterium]